MTRNLKRNCMIAVAGAAIIVGLGLAVRTAVEHPHPAQHVGAEAHAEAIRARDARTLRPPSAGTLEVAAHYLGIGSARLRSELRSGRTLAQLADATDEKSAGGLLQALLSARTRSLRAALASGRLSKAEVARRMTRLHERAAEQLARR
jgi:hypothetical protein